MSFHPDGHEDGLGVTIDSNHQRGHLGLPHLPVVEYIWRYSSCLYGRILLVMCRVGDTKEIRAVFTGCMCDTAVGAWTSCGGLGVGAARQNLFAISDVPKVSTLAL